MEAEQELARVRAKYAPARWWDILIFFGLLAALFVGIRFSVFDVWLLAGLLTGAIGWEVTKWRLRRNAEHFAARSGV